MIYALDSNSMITRVLDAVPTDESNYCIWNGPVDLQNYDYTVGSMDENHNVMWMNPPKPKPVPVLIQHIEDVKNSLETTVPSLNKKITDMQLALCDVYEQLITSIPPVSP